MATLRRSPPRFLGEAMRRKLEVSTAMAWEALVDSHVEQAAAFVLLLTAQEPIEESLPRYLREMDLHETMSMAIRTRVLAVFEEEGATRPAADDTASLRFPGRNGDDDDAYDLGWSVLRQSQRVVRGVRRRQRRSEEIERLTMLGLARAEENVIETHVENAIGFVALLEGHLPLDRAVQQYLGAVGLAGGRAQTVFQRTMARLAEVHLRP
jgi:hypothetical protein